MIFQLMKNERREKLNLTKRFYVWFDACDSLRGVFLKVKAVVFPDAVISHAKNFSE